MSQSYEPCFSFSVPPGKPCDPAYADPAPILLSRNASCKRRTDTAISNTSDEGASATSPFAFSVPSEPSSSYRHSFPGPGYSPGSSSAPDYPVRQTHHSHPPAAPLPHHEPRQVISKSIGPRNNHVPPPPPHPCPPPPFLFHSLNERQGQEPFCLGPAPPRKRPRRRFEEVCIPSSPLPHLFFHLIAFIFLTGLCHDLLEGGDKPLFLGRRMLICVSL